MCLYLPRRQVTNAFNFAEDYEQSEYVSEYMWYVLQIKITVSGYRVFLLRVSKDLYIYTHMRHLTQS
jgi:hypothetical protein